MTLFTSTHLALTAMVALTLGAGAALAQNDHHEQHPAKTDQPAPDGKPAGSPDAGDERIGDPYPLDTCPITGKKLGSMGDPVSKLYDGREVRFCCPACPKRFEKDLKASVAALDEKIIKDQSPLYPLKTSVVTGKDLPEKPFEFVFGNRLIRLAAETEKTEFTKDPEKYLGELDKAVVAAQGKDYPLKTCPVSNEELDGAMGKPVDLVIAGRLVRLCCKDCRKDVEKDPAKFITMIDAARKDDRAGPDSGKKNHDDK